MAESCYCAVLPSDPSYSYHRNSLSTVSSPHCSMTSTVFYQQQQPHHQQQGSQYLESYNNNVACSALVQSSSSYCCTSTPYQATNCYYCCRDLSCPAGFAVDMATPYNGHCVTSSPVAALPSRMVMSASSPREFSPYSNIDAANHMVSNCRDEDAAALIARSASGGAISAITSRRLLPPLPFDAPDQHQEQSFSSNQPVNLSRNQSFRNQVSNGENTEPNDVKSAFQRNVPLRISSGTRTGPRVTPRTIYGPGGSNGNYLNIPSSASGPELQQQALQQQQHSRVPVVDSPCTSEPGVPCSSSSSSDHASTLKTRLAELETERNRLQTELTSLSHHCSWAIRNRNDSYVEVERLKNEIQMIRMKAHSEMQVVVERLAAKEHEYALVMSERDTVLRELEDLQDRLTAAEKKISTVEGENDSLKAALDVANRNAEKAQVGGSDLEGKISSLEQVLNEKCDELESVRLRCEWAICERERLSDERDRLRALTEQLLRERDESNARVAELSGQLEGVTLSSNNNNNAANRTNKVVSVQRTVTSSSSTSSSMNNQNNRTNRSRDSAIDSDADLVHVREGHLVPSDSDENNGGRFLGIGCVPQQQQQQQSQSQAQQQQQQQQVTPQQSQQQRPSLPLPVEWPPSACNTPGSTPGVSQMVVSNSFPPSTPRSLRRPHLAGGLDDIVMRQINLFCESLPLLGDTSSVADFDQSVFVERCVGFKVETCDASSAASSAGPLVTCVEPASAASMAGIEVGDRMVEIAGVNVRTESRISALKILAQSGPSITLTVARSASSAAKCSPTFSFSPQVVRRPSRTGSIPRTTLKAPRYVYITRPGKSSNEDSDVELIGGNVSGIFVGGLAPENYISGPKKLAVGDQILEINGVSLKEATLEQAYVELNRPGEELVIVAQANEAKFEAALKRARTSNSGDGFYVRCLLDWQPVVSPDASNAPFYLPLQKDTVLYVDNTMPDRGHRTVGGFWSAWVLDMNGQPVRRGLIPSKLRFEDEPSLLLRRSTASLNNVGSSNHNNRSSTRLTNFIRRARLSSSAILSKLPRPISSSQQHHATGDSHADNLHPPTAPNGNNTLMIASSCSWTPDAVYQRVEPLDKNCLRPVVIFSPITDAIIHRLVSLAPGKFEALQTELIRSSIPNFSPSYSSSSLSYFVASDIARALQNEASGDLVQCQQGLNSHMETFSLNQILNASKQGRHCLLDVSPATVERLIARRVFPICIFVRHSSSNQLKRIKGLDEMMLPRKLSRNTASDLFDQFTQIEHEYRHLISVFYTVDSKRENSVDAISSQVAALIDLEQSKQQWVPSLDPL